MSDPHTPAPNNTAAHATAAAEAMSQAIAPRPGDMEHPAYEVLCAFAEGTLDAADREWIDAHLECCAICREDVADVSGIRAELAAPPIDTTSRGRLWLRVSMGVIATAAGLMMAIWLGRGTTPPPPQVDTPTATVAEVAPAPTALTDDESAAVARALDTGQLVFPDNIRTLRGQAGTLLSSPETGAEGEQARWTPDSPVGTMVETPQPTFSWPARTDADSYTVAVFDERFRQVTSSPEVKSTTWTPRQDLPRGQMLVWQVTAHRAGLEDVVSPAPPAPEARFQVLTLTDVDTLNDIRGRLADEPLARALTLTRLGLFDQARQSLTSALADTRYDAARVRELLNSLENRAR